MGKGKVVKIAGRFLIMPWRVVKGRGVDVVGIPLL
jgi:hypothetical protein